MIVAEMVVIAEESLKSCLQKIDQLETKLVFVVSSDSTICGVLSDGDIRRHLIMGGSLEEPTSSAMNKNYVSAPYHMPDIEAHSLVNEKITHVPVLDAAGVITNILTKDSNFLLPVMRPKVGLEEQKNVLECLNSTWISSKGKFVTEFENQFDTMYSTDTALTVSNGTVALHLALSALGITADDEVIVPDVTFAATINSVLYCNATPRICEVDPQTLCINPDRIKAHITERTKAIIIVHLYGNACDMTRVMQIANEHNLIVVEDCAESIGTKFDGKLVGSFGDAATFSFFGNKIITTGEGGMVVFKNKSVGQHARVLRDHGMSPTKRYWHDHVGYNYRLTNLQAAIGVAQIDKLDRILYKRREARALYDEQFRRCNYQVKFDEVTPLAEHCYWLINIFLETEAQVQQTAMHLTECGVETRPIFYPLSEMPIYQDYIGANFIYGCAQKYKLGLSLPSYFDLTMENIGYIAEKISELRLLTK